MIVIDMRHVPTLDLEHTDVIVTKAMRAMERSDVTVGTTIQYSISIFIGQQLKLRPWTKFFSLQAVRRLEILSIYSHGYSASFACLRLFPHLLVKFQNSFLCMCCRRMFCCSDHSPWETNLKSISFKVVLSWKPC